MHSEIDPLVIPSHIPIVESTQIQGQEEKHMVQQLVPEPTQQPNHVLNLQNAASSSFVPTRKSTRASHLPSWMEEFVSLNVYENITYSLSNYISYDALTPRYQSYLTTLFNKIEPSSFAEIVKDPGWVEVMKTEITA